MKVANCVDCHTTVDDNHQAIPGHFLAGGNPFPVEGKGKSYTANITSDKATGIGAYTDDDILRVLNQGVAKSGRPLLGMPWRNYVEMTEEDKRAIVVALRAVPPVFNAVPPPDLLAENRP